MNSEHLVCGTVISFHKEIAHFSVLCENICLRKCGPDLFSLLSWLLTSVLCVIDGA